MKTEILSTSEKDILKAGEILRNGGLVAFPTETVYGLGANALDDEAAAKIYQAKGRPSDNPLIVHIADKKNIAVLVAEINEYAQKLIDAFFPAPLSIIMKKSDKIGKTVSGGLDTVAIRMPENETARKVISAAKVPICAPSANTSGLPSPTKAQYVIDDMNGKIDAIIDGGDCEVGVESTVITVADGVPTILRPGAVTKEMMEKVLGCEVLVAKAVTEGMKKDEKAESPGMKYKHYSPKAKVVIVNADKEKYEKFVNSIKEDGVYALCFDDDNVKIPAVRWGNENDANSQAHKLFDALRVLDTLGAKKVYARNPKKDGVALAVYNRLIRAAAFDIIDLEKPFTIGITGTTGSGKSYVSKVFENCGFQIIKADEIARTVTEKGSETLQKLADAFGKEIVLKDGGLDRKLLAKKAFKDEKSTKILNEITHPEIIKRAISERKSVLTVFDAPQLFESNAEKYCYKTICVSADEKTRLERIMKRDGISQEDAKLRMNAQLSDEFFKNHTDFTIYSNDGDDINSQIIKILEEIL